LLAADAYFERSPAPSGGLFALGLVTLSLSHQITTGFTVSLAVEYPARGTDWEVVSSFQVVW